MQLENGRRTNGLDSSSFRASRDMKGLLFIAGTTGPVGRFRTSITRRFIRPRTCLRTGAATSGFARTSRRAHWRIRTTCCSSGWRRVRSPTSPPASRLTSTERSISLRRSSRSVRAWNRRDGSDACRRWRAKWSNESCGHHSRLRAQSALSGARRPSTARQKSPDLQETIRRQDERVRQIEKQRGQ